MAEILLPDWSHAAAVTPSDTVDNLTNALYLHNAGASGAVSVVFANGSQTTLFLLQGHTLRGGRWKRLRATGLGPGVQVVAMY